VSVTELIRDLRGVQDRLVDVLEPLTPEQWRTPTPAEGWDVRDQVAHVALVEEYAVTALGDPEAFALLVAESVADPDGFEARLCERGRTLDGEELLARWRSAAATLRALLADPARGLLEPGTRIAWFGPSMGVRSFLTARLMETWSHGQDVRDALGAPPDAGGALRHVAHLGVTTRGWSHVVRGLDPDPEPVAVRLLGPDGEEWTWGPSDASSAVAGTALDFCLVVTQRRHWHDTDLVATGAAARQWLDIAQAFAGPPTTTAPRRGLTKENQS
jgi:uncharacterized protein (TIGR03084 family)